MLCKSNAYNNRIKPALSINRTFLRHFRAYNSTKYWCFLAISHRCLVLVRHPPLKRRTNDHGAADHLSRGFSSISCLSEMTISYLPTHLALRATYLMLLRSLSLGNSRPRQQKNFTKTACNQKVIRGVSHTLNDYLKQMQHYSFC